MTFVVSRLFTRLRKLWRLDLVAPADCQSAIRQAASLRYLGITKIGDGSVYREKATLAWSFCRLQWPREFGLNASANMKMKFLASLLLATCFFLNISAAETISLDGQWQFALDRSDAGITEHWFAKNLADKIRLPGILESQGYGDEISISTPWVLSLYDHFWYLRADYAAYTNAGNVKVPFLCQPPRHYLGAAWYEREIDIPADWNGKRVTLFMERPHWKSTVWLDEKEIGSDISLCAPHEYDLGAVAPGKHRLSVRVDNRMILPYRLDAHSISDSLDDAWNGIVGKIELRATPMMWVDDVQIFPGTQKKSIRAHVVLRNASGQQVAGKISFHVEAAANAAGIKVSPSSENFSTAETNVVLDEEINLGDSAQSWDEFSPALYRLRVDVSGEIDGKPFEHKTETTFGLRDFHAEGNQFILNGHPIYFRGTHFGGDFPLTGYPATDVASWKKIFQTCKDYGLNHMRFHSWCPPEAAFEAADELGFYLQVECGMWNEFSPGGVMEKQLYSETERILKAFGNHPSLMLVSASNEAHGNWKPVLSEWVKHFRAEDPRRLYTPDTGWAFINSPKDPIHGGADYLVVSGLGFGRIRGVPGWFGRDYGEAIAGVTVPVIGHEVGQWDAYPDFRVIKKFTGFMHPGNYEIFRDSAAAHGVLEQNKEFARASGRFQVECYKEIEANLRTPGLSGFQLLDLHDYTGQGTALVGILDALWGSKGYTTPEEFKEFCNTIVPLARLKQRVFTTSDAFEVPVEAANFSDASMTSAQMSWMIRDQAGKVLAQDAKAPKELPIGKNISFGNISADLSRLAAPAQYTLEVAIGPQPLKSFGPTPHNFKNDWKFWVYPAHISDAAPANVLVTSSWDDAREKLAAGGRVLFLPHNADLDWSSPPLAQEPVFWNALMGPKWSRMLGLWCDTKHPALAEFPTEANCDWQWTELLHNTRAVNLDHLPKGLRPIVSAIDDWNRNYKLGLIFEARVGAGKLLVCSADLNGNSSPVAQQLRRSLLDYMGGNKFKPRTEISVADFESLHFNSRIMHELGATARADGKRANEIVDGDPNTFWCSADARGRGPKPPQVFEVSFPQPVAMSGLVLMPRQNERQHQGDIREYKFEASDDGTNWQSVASGELLSTFDEQKISFGRTVSAKELRLTDLSGFGNDTAGALAEIAVVYAGPKLAERNSGNVEYKNVRTASPDIDAGDGSGRTNGKR